MQKIPMQETPIIDIVDELPCDIAPRETLLDTAFGPQRRAKTCERLREGRAAADGLALVAVHDDNVVGTIRFWHVSAGGAPALMLGPVAVAPAYRSIGLGAALVRTGLERARTRGHDAVLLVGDAPYYERFGFARSAVATLAMPGPIERERFLGLEWRVGTLSAASGVVRPMGVRERVASSVVSAAYRQRRPSVA